MATPQNRVTAPLTLFRSTDADLVRWLETIPNGQRNSFVKNALRRGLNLPPRTSPDVVAAAELDKMRSDLDSLQRAVARVPDAVKALSSRNSPTNPIDNTRLEAIERDLDRIGDWLEGFQQQLNQLTAAVQSGAPIALPVDEPGERLSDDDVAAMERNLLQNEW